MKTKQSRMRAKRKRIRERKRQEERGRDRKALRMEKLLERGSRFVVQPIFAVGDEVMGTHSTALGLEIGRVVSTRYSFGTHWCTVRYSDGREMSCDARLLLAAPPPFPKLHTY